MKKVIDSKEILDLLNKKYILAAVAISNMKGYYVSFVKDKYIFSNANVTYKFNKETFLNTLCEYNFYLIDNKEDISINQSFDITTLKQ